MSAAAAWERIVRAALLGTERQPGTDETVTGDAALDGAIMALADRPAEARLLETAALLDAWRRAGRRPMRTSASPEPSPEAEERPCTPLAARVLRELLAGGPPPLLAEWMVRAADAGTVIPPELLPAVLDFARRHAETRDDVARALGPRGRWLAAQNPAWSLASAPVGDPAEGWETGTAEERVHILRHLRRTDPPAAIALLRTTWDTDAPRDRAAFVEALATGLGMDDEPFLDSLLDDKRKEVRSEARRLLVSLPQSRLIGRMTERLVPLLTLQAPEGLLSRIRGASASIAVQLPAECDKAMRRDGIDPKPPHGVGERAWWLQQMLVAVPPAFWAARWGRDAVDLLQAARAGEEGDILLRAWTEAAQRFRDAEWAEALLRMEKGPVGGWLQALASVLPPARLEALILERIPANGLRHDASVMQILPVARFPWSPALTRAVLAALPQPMEYYFREWLRAFAPYLHPATAVAVLREQGDPHEGPWVDLLHLRSTLHQAFA